MPIHLAQQIWSMNYYPIFQLFHHLTAHYLAFSLIGVLVQPIIGLLPILFCTSFYPAVPFTCIRYWKEFKWNNLCVTFHPVRSYLLKILLCNFPRFFYSIQLYSCLKKERLRKTQYTVRNAQANLLLFSIDPLFTYLINACPTNFSNAFIVDSLFITLLSLFVCSSERAKIAIEFASLESVVNFLNSHWLSKQAKVHIVWKIRNAGE